MRILRALTGLMPNLRGPIEGKRKLFYNVIISILLYGAPVWYGEFCASRSKQIPFRRIQRVISARVVCAYRTVSLGAATLLAGFPPIHLLSQSRAEVFFESLDLRKQNLLTRIISNRIKAQVSVRLRDKWRTHIRDYRLSGKRTRLAIRAELDGWLVRRHGNLSFHMTQILTGHGCFNTFLFRIQKSDTDMCLFCNIDVDSPEHTLEICPSWHTEREALTRVIGARLTLKEIIKAIVRSEEAWSAFRVFCEVVLTKKEEAERTREAEARALLPIDQRIDRNDDSDIWI